MKTKIWKKGMKRLSSLLVMTLVFAGLGPMAVQTKAASVAETMTLNPEKRAFLTAENDAYRVELTVTGMEKEVNEKIKVLEQQTTQVPVFHDTDVVLVIDVSNSMNDNGKWEKVKEALGDGEAGLIFNILKGKHGLNRNNTVSYVFFAGSARDTTSPDYVVMGKDGVAPIGTVFSEVVDAQAVYKGKTIPWANQLINNVYGGATNSTAGFRGAKAQLAAIQAAGRNRVVIYITDGEPTVGYDESGKKIGDGASSKAYTLFESAAIEAKKLVDELAPQLFTIDITGKSSADNFLLDDRDDGEYLFDINDIVWEDILDPKKFSYKGEFYSSDDYLIYLPVGPGQRIKEAERESSGPITTAMHAKFVKTAQTNYKHKNYEVKAINLLEEIFNKVTEEVHDVYVEKEKAILYNVKDVYVENELTKATEFLADKGVSITFADGTVRKLNQITVSGATTTFSDTDGEFSLVYNADTHKMKWNFTKDGEILKDKEKRMLTYFAKPSAMTAPNTDFSGENPTYFIYKAHKDTGTHSCEFGYQIGIARAKYSVIRTIKESGTVIDPATARCQRFPLAVMRNLPKPPDPPTPPNPPDPPTPPLPTDPAIDVPIPVPTPTPPPDTDDGKDKPEEETTGPAIVIDDDKTPTGEVEDEDGVEESEEPDFEVVEDEDEEEEIEEEDTPKGDIKTETGSFEDKKDLAKTGGLSVALGRSVLLLAMLIFTYAVVEKTRKRRRE